MRRLLLVASLAMLASAGFAQSLEQSYAQLCSGADKSSETCATLRKALMDKPAKDGSADKPVKASAATVKPGKVGPGWRLYGALAGKTLVDEDGNLHRFEWLEKGAVLQSTRETLAGPVVTRYELKTDGVIMALSDGRPPLAMEPNGKTSFVVLTPGADGTAGERWRYSPTKDGFDVVQESLVKGKWVATGKRSSRSFATAETIAVADAKLKAARDTVISDQWKALGRMAGKDFLWRATSGTVEDQIVTVRWIEFGRTASMKWINLPSMSEARSLTFTRDPSGTFTAVDSKNFKSTITAEAQKLAVLWTSDTNGRGTAFHEWVPSEKGLTLHRGRIKKGKRRDEDKFSFIDVTAIDRKKLAEAADHSLAERKQAARQQEMAQKNNGGGGGGMFGRMLGGALMGAMLGGGGEMSAELAVAGAQAAAQGGNTYEVLTQMGGVAQSRADESKRELDATIARAEAQAAEQRAQKRREEEQAAAKLAENRATTAAEATRQREAADREAAAAKAKAEEAARQKKAADEKAKRDEAARLAEAERNRPVEWKEGMVLCQQRPNSKEWRCPGPLQVTYASFEKPNYLSSIGMACGSSNTGKIRDVGMVSGYRVFGCGFGIHPTLRDYPGNTDVPAQMGVFVDNRRIFHCPKTRDAYCSNP